MAFKHSKCGKIWSGFKMCHCGTCCETFSTLSNFDAHRANGKAPRKCNDPKVRGLVQNERGIWTQPGT